MFRAKCFEQFDDAYVTIKNEKFLSREIKTIILSEKVQRH